MRGYRRTPPAPRAARAQQTGLTWLPAACCLFVLAFTVATAARAAGRRQLVPAQFSSRTDERGFRWDINRVGAVQHGTNYAFNGGMQLHVNGNAFQCMQPR